MLGLQIHTPRDGVFEGFPALLEDLDRLGVLDLAALAPDQRVQPLGEPLVHEVVEELDLGGAGFQHVPDDVPDHIPREFHTVVDIGEGDLRLDHPELGGVARRVRVLGAEGRTESVDVPKRHRVGLALKLPRDRQVRASAEEVLRIIDLAVLGFRRVLEIEGRHAEHLARALAVRRRDQGRMHVDEAAVVEETVNGVRRLAPHAKNGGEQVGARTQVGDLAQVFDGVPLLLQRIIGGRGPLDFDGLRLDLKGLLRPRGQFEFSRHDQRRPDVLRGDLVVVVDLLALEYDLHRLKAAAVVEIDEAERPAVADRARPAPDRDGRPAERRRFVVEPFDGGQLFFHLSFPRFSLFLQVIITHARRDFHPFRALFSLFLSLFSSFFQKIT